MSLRMPQNLSTLPRFETGLSVLEAEIAQERAFALGRLGREIELALETLNTVGSEASERPQLVDIAADATWRFLVQREACGMFDHQQAISHYGISREVLARVGAR